LKIREHNRQPMQVKTAGHVTWMPIALANAAQQLWRLK